MQNTANIERDLIETLRLLTPDKQQEVLDFTRSLQRNDEGNVSPLQLSLTEIANLSVAERHRLLSPYISDMVNDFATDPELTEFADLDIECWDRDDD